VAHRRTVIDQQLDEVSALGNAVPDELRRVLWPGDHRELLAEGQADQHGRVPAKYGRASRGRPDIRHVIALCGHDALIAQPLRNGEHVHFGGDPEQDGQRERVAGRVSVRVDEPRQQRGPGPVDDLVSVHPMAGRYRDDAAAFDYDVDVLQNPLAVENARARDDEGRPGSQLRT
jgi:hypothetical protein